MNIYILDGLPEERYAEAGGKAAGLAKLHAAGMKIARGFVVCGAEREEDFAEAAAYYEKNGYGAVAVRSSASAEDGTDFSSAGQYATLLDVSGRGAVKNALAECAASLGGNNAESYAGFFAAARSSAMSIVVQEMVNAAFAGVCFTRDPVTGESAVIVEAVRGLGEKLVSGHAAAEKYTLPIHENGAAPAPVEADAVRNGPVRDGPVRNGRLLSAENLRLIVEGALHARAHFGCELDLEWAIDGEGVPVWLQARPVTTAGGPQIDEFDSPWGDENTVFTTCNVGEMLPGAVTPLSLSTSVLGIDSGLRRMLLTAGAYKNEEELPAGSCITSFGNHLFFNLTTVYKLAPAVLGARKNDVEASICGRALDTPPLPWKNAHPLIRLKNGAAYFRYLFSRRQAKKAIVQVTEKIAVPPADDMMVLYDSISAALPFMYEATHLHYITSAHSGAMSSVLLTIFRREGKSETEAREMLSGLLEEIGNIESADILRSMRRIAQEALAKEKDAAAFSPEALLELIENDSGPLSEAYRTFLDRHGHRAIREAELRSASWRADRRGLAENILTVIKSGAEESPKPAPQYQRRRAEVLRGRGLIGKKMIGWLIDQAREGVVNREFTKSFFIKAVDRVKEGYSALAAFMVKNRVLPDGDLIYFLTHAEIGELLRDKKAGLVKRALRRRRLLDEQKELVYDSVYTGRPVPGEAQALTAECGTVLQGVPISRGEAKGPARVIRTVEDAKMLRAGEIMVAAFTDIGWSPWYSIIGGLVTEVGSALSHGAVVAREYALPLVVNIAAATKRIQTGDLLHLDGTKGTVTVLASGPSRA